MEPRAERAADRQSHRARIPPAINARVHSGIGPAELIVVPCTRVLGSPPGMIGNHPHLHRA